MALITATTTGGDSLAKQVDVSVLEDASDLTLGPVTIDTYPVEAEGEHTLSVEAINQGTQDTTSVEVTLSVDGTNLETQTIDLSASSEQTLTFDFTPSMGSQTVQVEIDPTGAITESDETNNTSSQTFTGLDLDKPSLDEVILTEIIYEGGDIELSVQASDNVGVDRVVVGLDSTNTTLTYNSTDDRYETTLTAPAAGDWKMYITVTDTSGLKHKLTRTITVHDVRADLTAQLMDLSLEDLPLSEGETLTMTLPVSNEGGTDVSGLEVSFRLDGSEIDSDTIDVAAGETAEASITWTGVYGEYDLEVAIDPNNTVTESDETNNEVEREIVVFDTTAPDAPSPSSSPSTWTTSNGFTISWSAVTDARGIQEYRYRFNQGEWTSNGTSTSISLTETEDGIHPCRCGGHRQRPEHERHGNHLLLLRHHRPGPTPDERTAHGRQLDQSRFTVLHLGQSG